MDRKTILVLIVCVVCFVLLNIVTNNPKWFPPVPRQTNAAPVTTQSATATNASGTAPAVAPAPAAVARLVVNTNEPEQLLVLTNDTVRYTFTSRGGGVKTIELLKYSETVERKQGPQPARPVALNRASPTPVVAILDGDAVQGDGVFRLTNTATGVRAEKALSSGLVIVKDFEPGSNYLLSATVRLENRSGAALALPGQEWTVGTAAPLSKQDESYGGAVGLMWYNGESTAMMMGRSYFSPSGFMCMPKTPNAEYRQGQTNVVWVAVYNQFFALALMPQDRALQVVSRKVELPRPEEWQDNPQAPKLAEGYETRIVYPPLTLATNQVVERRFTIYSGPKEYQTLSRIAAQLKNNLDALMSFGWAGFFSKALLLAMNWLHNALLLPYGWCIIAITVIIKLVFWPLTKKSNQSMKKMQALAPEVNALKEKYKDDLQKFFQKQRELYRKHNVSQFGGCLPMLIQIPVFFGLYGMIRTAIELRGAHFLWVNDLSQPDTLFVIPGLGIPFNLLPILYIASALWQSHLTPASPGMDPTQQKMIRWMPLIFLLILYNFSSGLALYMTTQNLLTIAQTKLTKVTTPVVSTGNAPALTPPPKRKK